jgi:cation-transporting ATPase E
LKSAHLAIAMQNGSQAARSVADIVLVEDSFASLPATVQEGQRILTGMQDILKLFMSRVFYTALLIISTGFIGGFPQTPKQNAILTFLTVGIPSLALAAWAQPSLVSPKTLVRRMVHFVLPAAFTLSLFALIVYAINILSIFHPGLVPPGSETDPNANAFLLATAQTSLTIFAVVCGLLLIVFVEPPFASLTGGDALTMDWRPAVLAGALFLAFMVVLAVPGLRASFDLVPLGVLDYLFIGVMITGWAFFLRYVWRARLLDRLLSLE